MLGLPDGITACLFDLDGVLTKTAEVHARAWKQTFDAFLKTSGGEALRPRARLRRVRRRQAAPGRRARLPGLARDRAARRARPTTRRTRETVHGLANAKNELVLRLIREQGVEAYEGSVRYLQAARDAGLRRAVVSSSHNCHDVLVAAGIEDLLEVRVDGVVAEERHLRGKPAPDTFLEAARILGVAPEHAAVFEDALAGVQAGHDGGFGYVVGVDRAGQRDALLAHGASVVVDDLAELL